MSTSTKPKQAGNDLLTEIVKQNQLLTQQNNQMVEAIHQLIVIQANQSEQINELLDHLSEQLDGGSLSSRALDED